MIPHLAEQFCDEVEKARLLPTLEERVELLREWLQSAQLDDVKEECKRRVSSDVMALARSLTPNPPAVLELGFSHGYALQLLFWFPIAALEKYANYDTEDIHSHFGTIVTKALEGTPYKSVIFERMDNRVTPVREKDFFEGDVDVIYSQSIHSVRHQDGRTGLSLRVVFPYDTAYMDVFDSKTLQLKERIWCGSEQKMVELAGIMAAFDLQDCFEATKREILADEGLIEAERLYRLAH